MDIDLLSKMVKEVILDNDSVTLPGIGSFVAEVVPSSFSDRGYTINPPYRRLFFTQREGGDTLLVDAYCRSNSVSVEDATRILVDFLSEMKEILKVRKSIVFPGLGRLRATRENNFFFVADEDLDIYPAGFGLEPVSLKTHEETPEEVSAAIAGLKAVLENPVPAEEEIHSPVAPAQNDNEEEPEQNDSEAEPVQSDSESAPAQKDGEGQTEESAAPVAVEAAKSVEDPADAPVRRGGRFWRSLLVVLFTAIALAALAVILFILTDYFAPALIDRLLYTPEQLEILHY